MGGNIVFPGMFCAKAVCYGHYQQSMVKVVHSEWHCELLKKSSKITQTFWFVYLLILAFLIVCCCYFAVLGVKLWILQMLILQLRYVPAPLYCFGKFLALAARRCALHRSSDSPLVGFTSACLSPWRWKLHVVKNNMPLLFSSYTLALHFYLERKIIWYFYSRVLIWELPLVFWEKECRESKRQN